MMNNYYSLFLLLFFSLWANAHIERFEKVYASTKNNDLDNKLCVERYQEELEFTEQISNKLAAQNVCQDQGEINGLIAEVNGLLSSQSATIAQVSLVYKRLLDSLAKCRMDQLSKLTDVSTLKRDFGATDQERKKLFIHVLGDVFAKETGLEGSDGGTMLRHRLRELKAIKNQMGQLIFINDADQAKPCRRLTNLFDEKLYKQYPEPDLSEALLNKLIAQSELALQLFNKSREPSLLEFRDLLKGSLLALHPKESLFFPTSWSGHAIVFELTREDDNHLRFRMFNSGDAINTYHVTSVLGHQVKYSPYVELNQVPIENMTSLVVLSALKEVYSPKGQSSRPEDFYERFLPSLGGKVAPPTYDEDFFKDPQNSGTCSYASLPWVMSSCVPDPSGTMSTKEQENIGGRVEYLIKLRTLFDYATLMDADEKMQNDEEARNLLQKGMTYFSGNTADALDDGLVSNQELTGVTRNLINLKQSMGRLRTEVSKKNEQQSNSFVGYVSPPTSFPKIRGLPSVNTLAGAEAMLKASDKNTQIAAKLMFRLELPSQLPQHKNELNGLLNRLIIELRRGLEDGYYINVLSYVSQIAHFLPIQSEFWQGITREQAFATITHVRALDELYLFALLKAISGEALPDNQLASERWLISLKLLAVADAVNVQAFDSASRIASLYSDVWGQILLGDRTMVSFTDPLWQKEYNQLRSYFAKNKSDRDFFGLAKIPAGANYAKRIFDDLSALPKLNLAPSLKKWEDIQFSQEQRGNDDVAWATKLIESKKGTQTYENWLSFAGKTEKITDIIFKWEPQLPPDATTENPVPRDKTSILTRRAAIKLIAGQPFAEDDFLKTEAQLFRDLQSISLIASYLLTGDLSQDRFLKSDFKDYQKGIFWEMKKDKVILDETYETLGKARQAKLTEFDCFTVGLNIFGVSSSQFRSGDRDKSIEIFYPSNTPLFSYVKPYFYLMKANNIFDIFTPDMYSVSLRNAVLAIFDQAFQGKQLVKNAEPERLRLDSNRIASTNAKSMGLSELGLERMRALLNLSSSKKLQLDRTLGYFSSKPFLFAAQQKAYRALFEKLMFDQGLLSKELSINPQHAQAFANRLASFCEKIFNYYRPSNDINALAFILRMNELFKLHAQSHELNTQRFMNAAVVFTELIQRLKPTQTQEKSFLWRNLAQTYLHRARLDKEDVTNLLTAQIGHNAIQLVNKMLLEPEEEASIKNILLVKQDEISRVLSKDADEILTAVLENIQPQLPKDVEINWSRDNDLDPIWQAQIAQKRFFLDVAEGALHEDGNKIVSFPIDTASYQEVFGKQAIMPSMATKIGDKIYEWVDQNTGDLMRAEKSAWGSAQFQRRVGNSWFHLLPYHEVDNIKQSQAVNPELKNWLEVSLTDPSRKILLTDPMNGEIVQTVLLDEQANISSITRTKDQATQINAIGQGDFDAFKSLEDERHIYVWDMKDGSQNIEVRLPRLGLIFKMLPSENTLDCASFTEYKLAKVQYAESLDKPFNYLVCEPRANSQATSKIAIMVAQHPRKTAQQQALMASDFVLDRLSNNFKANFAQDLVVYRLDDTSDDGVQKAIPQSLKARYYLALRYQWLQKYRMAQAVLNDQAAKITKATTLEKKILEWLREGNAQDHDVRALAIRLQALHILGVDFLQYDRFPRISFKIGNQSASYLGQLIVDNRKLYEDYLNKFESIGSGWLEQKTELALAQWFAQWIIDFREHLGDDPPDNAYDSRLLNRLALLKNYEGVHNVMEGYKNLKVMAREERDIRPVKIAAPATIHELSNYINKPVEAKAPLKEGVLQADPANPVINPETFPIFYQAAIEEELSPDVREAALKILKSVLVLDNEIDHLTNQQIRAELLRLAHFSTLKSPDFQYSGTWEVARFLTNIFELKDKSQIKRLPWLATSENGLSFYKYLRQEYGNEPEKIAQTFQILQHARNQFEQHPTTVFPDIRQHQVAALSKPSKEKRRTEMAVRSENLSHLSVKDPLKEDLVSVERFNKIFIEHGIVSAKSDVDSAWNLINSRLSAAKDAPKISADVKLSVEALLQRTKDKFDEIKKTQKQYAVNSWVELDSLKSELEMRLYDVQQGLQQSKSEILALARKYDSGSVDGNYDQLLRLADIEKQVEMNDVIYSLLTHKLEKFYSLNGSITPAETTFLATKTIEYLVNSTFASHLGRVVQGLSEFMKQADKSPAAIDYQLNLENVLSLLQSKRAYDISEQIEYLVFEYFMGITIRPNQKIALDALEIKDGKIGKTDGLGRVIELIMGAGKTSVILPLICALQSDGKWLNVVVLPESLITSMAKELSEQLNKSFQKHVDVLDISNVHSLDGDRLNILKERIKNARIEGRTIVTTNSSIQGLFLAVINKLESGEYEAHLQNPPRKILTEIFDIFKTSGKLTIDEVDLALDVMRAQQIAAGRKIPVPYVLKATISSFYQMMAMDPAIYDSYALGFLPYAQGEPLTDESFAGLKEALIKALVATDQKSFLSSHGDLDALYREYLSNNGNEKLIAYWRAPTVKTRSEVMSKIDNDQLKDVVAIIAEELNGTFLLTAKKKIDIHFGALPKPELVNDTDEVRQLYENLNGEYSKSRFVAIPYHNGTPMVQSRFASAIESINYTLQKDLKLQNIEPYIRLELELLKKLGSGSPYFNPRYKKLMGDASETDINELTDQQINDVAERHKDKSRVADQIRFTTNHALSQIGVYEKQLQTNAQIYEFIFHTVRGFSGTLWSYQTFPDIFFKPTLSDTSPITILTLLSSPSTVLALQPGPLDDLVRQIYDNWEQPGSFIDEAGTFRAYPNFLVAGAIMKYMIAYQNTSVEGVIYYDDKNEIAILDRNLRSSPLADSAIPKDKRIAFWDKQHTTGSDLKLNNRMQAKLSVDSHIKLRDDEQASFRLRGLGKGQRIVQFVIWPEDLKVITKKLATYDLNINEIQPADLLTYSVLNQEEYLSFLKWRAFGQRLKNKVVKAAVGDILNINLSGDEAIERYQQAKDLFVMDAPQHPHQVYGLPMELLPKDEAIILEVNMLKQAPAYKAYGTPEVEGEILKTVEREKPFLPDNIMMPRFAQQGTEIQIELNLQTQTRTQTQTQTAQFDPSKSSPYGDPKSWDLLSKGQRIYQADFFFQNPMMNAVETFRNRDKSLTPLFNALDHRIYFSANFAPVENNSFVFFDQFGKQLTEVLVIYERATKSYSLVLIDSNDSLEWKTALLSDHGENNDSRMLDFALYELQSGQFIASGFQTMEGQNPNENPSFARFIAQAKFFAGILHYSEREKIELVNWINENGNFISLKEIFKNHIMSYRDDTMSEYMNSFMAEIFGDQN